jgi:CBS domain-containing protein
MKVSDLIGYRKNVYSIPDSFSVLDVAKYLREKKVRSAGVVDEQGRLVGVISHADVSDKVAAENKCPAWMKASEIMSTGLLTVSPEAGIDECLKLMEQNSVYHLLVIGEENRYLGMVSVSDMLRVIASDQKARADLLESYMFPSR